MAHTFDHEKVEEVRLRKEETGLQVDLPVREVSVESLPEVTIVIVTRNRKHFGDIIIDNWKRLYYPYHKCSLLIVDDSDDIEQSPIRALKALNDKRIRFHWTKPENGPFSVGYKRNLAMSLVTTEYVTFVDDDDFLPNESVLLRVCALKYYDKQCVYAYPLGVYNVQKETSYVLENYKDVPEGTLLLTKSFWAKNRFGEGQSGEGWQLVQGQELHMLKMPFLFILIALSHKTNLTGKTRQIRLPNSGEAKLRMSTGGGTLDLKKSFPDSFIQALESVKRKQQ